MQKTGFFLFVPLVVLFLAATSQANLFGQTPEQSGFVRLDRVTASRATTNGIEIRSGAAVMQIAALRDDVLRVRVGPNGQLPEDASWAVLPAVAHRYRRRHSRIHCDLRRLQNRQTPRLHPKRIRCEMTVTDIDGHVISADLPGRPIEFNGAAFRVYKKSPEDEHYFGLGDKPGPLDRRNEAFTDWNTDAFGWQESTDPIYKSIPYFIDFPQGRLGRHFPRQHLARKLRLQQGDIATATPSAPKAARSTTTSSTVRSRKTVVETWAWLTGTTPIPPLWSLGYQQSRYSYYPESEVRRIAGKLRSERIPADVIWLDIDYQLKNRPFTVDPERFPHFDQMIKDLRAEHLRTVVITDLHIADLPNIGYKPYDEGIAGDHFVKNPDGSTYVGVVWPGKAVFPDFTQKSSRDWWGTLYSDFVAKGIAGFWNDMNEPAIFDVPSKTMPDDVRHRIEEPGFLTRVTNHLEVHNIFGMQNSRGTYEGLLKLQPNDAPIRHDPRQLCRRPALRRHLDRRQLQHLEPSAPNHTAAAQPRPQRVRHERSRCGRLCRLSATRTAHALARGRGLPAHRPRPHRQQHQPPGTLGKRHDRGSESAPTLH